MIGWLANILINYWTTKKTFAAAGAVAGFTSVGVLVASAAYTDKKHDESQAILATYITSKKEYDEAVISGIKEVQKIQQESIMIFNENLHGLQRAIITGQEQKLKKINLKKNEEK